MSFEINAGGIYAQPFPYSDLLASKAWPALTLKGRLAETIVRYHSTLEETVV